ncbi:MAG: hypothetical protein MJ082_00915 [Clostridia bacterium]|nr:hypothetical protein [Clostridia bacterium]
MKETKKLTLSSVICALNVALLALGAAFETLDLTICALTSLTIVFLCIEVRGAYPVGAWLVTSVLTFIFFPGKAIWAEYFLVFGSYPIAKDKIERLPRVFRVLLKLCFFFVSVTAILWLFGGLFGMPVFGSEENVSEFFFGLFPNLSYGVKLGMIYGVCLVCGVAYDLFINVSLRLYFWKYRPKFARFLK